jgi:hypothetical protein
MHACTGKALALLGEKAEYMAATGPDVRSVAAGTAATSAQARNIALCSQLQEVHRSLGSLLPRLPGTAAPALAAALDTLQVGRSWRVHGHSPASSCVLVLNHIGAVNLVVTCNHSCMELNGGCHAS